MPSGGNVNDTSVVIREKAVPPLGALWFTQYPHEVSIVKSQIFCNYQHHSWNFNLSDSEDKLNDSFGQQEAHL